MFTHFLSITSPLVSFVCDLTVLSSSILFRVFCKIQPKRCSIFFVCPAEFPHPFFPSLCLRSAASQGFSIRPVERGWKCDSGCPDWLSLTFWRNPLSCPHSLLHLPPCFFFFLVFSTSSFPGFIVPAPVSFSSPVAIRLCFHLHLAISISPLFHMGWSVSCFSPQKIHFTLFFFFLLFIH